MAMEALISEQGARATLRIGTWTAEVDAAELRAWAAYSGFDLVMSGEGESKIVLRDAAQYKLVRLAWTDAASP